MKIVGYTGDEETMEELLEELKNAVGEVKAKVGVLEKLKKRLNIALDVL